MEVPRGVFALSRILRVAGSSADTASGADAESHKAPSVSLPSVGKDGLIHGHASSSSGDLVLVLTRRCPRLVTVTLSSKEGPRGTDGVHDGIQRVADVRAVAWFDAPPELHPSCLALSPSEDFVAVATRGGELFVAPTQLLAPGFTPKERDCNFRSWSDSSVTALPSKDLSNRLTTYQQRPSKPPNAGAKQGSVEPTALLWWTTQDFGSVAYIGTTAGDLICVDLVTGAEIGLVTVFDSGAPVNQLETVTDASLDCTHLILTAAPLSSSKGGAQQQQARILIDQRSTGVSWPVSGGSHVERGHKRTPSSSSSTTAAVTGEQGSSRSRLSGLKQMSVAGLANLKQRLHEGRRMLSSSSSAGSSSERGGRAPPSPSVEIGQDALEVANCNGSATSSAAASWTDGCEDPLVVGVEQLSQRVGGTRVSVQDKIGNGDQTLLAGIFPDTAILTLHNSELEVLPQTAYKLPRGTDHVLLLDDKVILVATSSRSDTSARCRQSQLHLISALHAELHLESTSKGEPSVLQSFTLGPQESILALVKIRESSQDSDQKQKKDRSPESAKSSRSQSSLSSHDTPVGHRGLSDAQGDEFAKRVEERSIQVRKLSKLSTRRLECLVVTTEALYLLEVSSDPAGNFLFLAMTGGQADMEHAGYLAVAFSLDARLLFELAADLKLCQREFASAISLYRQAGCKHLRVVLKFASSGCISQLLSYLVVLFKTPNLEVSPADRIHLSNLALMAYFQQVLTKSTPTARSKFSAQIRCFLDENRYFDECLAVRLAAETREWDCLAHLIQIRGLACEMAEAAVAVAVAETRLGEEEEKEKEGSEDENVEADVGRGLREMSNSEREGLLSCLLHDGTVEAVVTASFSSPLAKRAAMKHLKVLSATLPLLEEAGLASVLRQCAPSNAGLRSAYLLILNGRATCPNETRASRSRERGGNEGHEVSDEQVSRALVNLTLSTALLLLKKRKTKGSATSECKPVCDKVPKRYVMSHLKGNDLEKRASVVPKVRQQWLSAGAGHVLMVTKSGRQIWTWGCSASGVLGRGATAARFCTPRRIDLFPRSSGIRVRAVACGKAHSLALTDAGLFAWGSSSLGQLGLGRSRRAEQRPAVVKGLMRTNSAPVVSIAAGQYHSAAVDAAGSVWTWGWGVHGQLGNGDIEDVFHPIKVFKKKTKKAAQVLAGYAHTLVITTEGQLWSFGCGLFGQLGIGTTKKMTIPQKVPLSSAKDPVRVAECGYFHNLAVTESGKVYSWGCNPQVLRLEAQQKKRVRLSQAVDLKKVADAVGKLPSDDDKSCLTAGGSFLKDIKRHAKQAYDDIRSYDGNKLDNSEVPSVVSNGTADDVSKDKPNLQDSEDEKPAHLLPTEVDIFPLLAVPVVGVACGNQHSLLLTSDGGVFSVGRNMDGQLGTGSRKESRTPTAVQALAESRILSVGCGGDYSVALAEGGSAFGWGNNSSGQLGRPPVDESANAGEANTKVVVMKTTRRIIRLQNSLQNSCDVPRPIPGTREASLESNQEDPSIQDGVYHGREDFGGSSDEEQIVEWSREAGQAMLKTRGAFEVLAEAVAVDDDPETLLHLTLELFAGDMLTTDRELCKKRTKQCLVADNLQAAAKINLLAGKYSHAFDFSLQLIIKSSGANIETSSVTQALFSTFLFYFKETVQALEIKSGQDAGDEEALAALQVVRKQLLERLIACWQDQGFSFVQLESLFLSSLSSEPQLLQTLVLNLFKPEDDDREVEEESPARASSPLSGGSAASSSGGPGPRMVDLFTPEFCLRIGDTCVREMGEEASKWMRGGQSGKSAADS